MADKNSTTSSSYGIHNPPNQQQNANFVPPTPIIVDQYGNPIHFTQECSTSNNQNHNVYPSAIYGGQQQQQHTVDQFGNPIQMAQPVPINQCGQSVRMQPQYYAMDATSNITRDQQGNALCIKCSAPYPLPRGCTSWRCRNCGELNNSSIYGDECCIIL